MGIDRIIESVSTPNTPVHLVTPLVCQPAKMSPADRSRFSGMQLETNHRDLENAIHRCDMRVRFSIATIVAALVQTNALRNQICDARLALFNREHSGQIPLATNATQVIECSSIRWQAEILKLLIREKVFPLEYLDTPVMTGTTQGSATQNVSSVVGLTGPAEWKKPVYFHEVITGSGFQSGNGVLAPVDHYLFHSLGIGKRRMQYTPDDSLNEFAAHVPKHIAMRAQSIVEASKPGALPVNVQLSQLGGNLEFLTPFSSRYGISTPVDDTPYVFNGRLRDLPGAA